MQCMQRPLGRLTGVEIGAIERQDLDSGGSCMLCREFWHLFLGAGQALKIFFFFLS